MVTELQILSIVIAVSLVTVFLVIAHRRSSKPKPPDGPYLAAFRAAKFKAKAMQAVPPVSPPPPRRNLSATTASLKRADPIPDDQPAADDGFLTSMAIGAMTNNAALGGMLGGNMAGGLVGDMLDGSLDFGSPSSSSSSSFDSGSSFFGGDGA